MQIGELRCAEQQVLADSFRHAAFELGATANQADLERLLLDIRCIDPAFELDNKVGMLSLLPCCLWLTL